MVPSLSSLRLSQQSNERLAKALNVYMVHRPVIQRLLNISFVAFILSSAYFGITGKPSANQSSKKGKSKKGKDVGGRPERVAVRSILMSATYPIMLHPHLSLGRRHLLSASATYFAHRYTWNSIKRSAPTCDAFHTVSVTNSDITVCCGARRKVSRNPRSSIKKHCR